ncbi:hypothetical protein QTO34_014381 [Cnephaeus nilssonii]|uniref:ferroxidase n=1 Tax=Cnephaeus nilssonii TaxID=3371016 RepID=A0AA40I7B0_CNENI|nr:hypothetical protein QTO34_014381 [Eptesicus nilssonii]
MTCLHIIYVRCSLVGKECILFLPILNPIQACNSIDESVQPSFATFFEDQANVKRENGKEFLEYLGKCGNKICLPVFKRPEIDYWGTGLSALECALELEDQLTKLLMDLKTTASAKKERDVLEFTGKYLKGQKKSTKNLQIKIGYSEMAVKHPLSEECSVAINHVASYEMHVSDAYLSMVNILRPRKFDVRKAMPRGDFPVSPQQRHEIDNWQTGMKALECALELEKHLTKLLLDLMLMAIEDDECDVRS